MPTNKILYLVLVSLTCCREWISLACSARFLNCTLAWFILCRSFMGLSWMFRSKNDLCVNISCHLHIDQTLLRFCSKILFWTKYGMVSMEYILLSWDKLKDLRGKFFNRQLTHKGGRGGGTCKGRKLAATAYTGNESSTILSVLLKLAKGF